MATAKRTSRLRPKNLARVQNILTVMAEAQSKGNELTRQELFNVLVERKKEKDGIAELGKFGQLIRDAIRLGHVRLKELKDSRPQGSRWEDWENLIVLSNTRSEAHKLLPHRTPGTIGAQKYKLTRLKPLEVKTDKRNIPLTKEERDILRLHYPQTENIELHTKFFPTRSIGTIISIARRMGLRKTKSIVPTMDPNKKIIEDILHVANARGITAVQLDKIVNANGYFKWNWKNEHRRLHLLVVERAARFLGLRLRLEPLPEAPSFRQMVREWKVIKCQITEDDPKKPRQDRRPKPPRPSKQIGTHRPKPEILELAESVVPRQHPLRQDVINDIVVAYYEGELTKEDFSTPAGLRAIRDMANAARRNNFELGGFARSMDAPLGDSTSTLHDMIAAE